MQYSAGFTVKRTSEELHTIFGEKHHKRYYCQRHQHHYRQSKFFDSDILLNHGRVHYYLAFGKIVEECLRFKGKVSA